MTEQVSLPLSDDALRMRGEPGNLEWWYFDATLDDGGTIVLVYYVDVATSGEMFYTATIMVARPGKPVVYKEYKTPDGSASRERPEYRAGKNTVSGDLMTYRLVIDAAELGGIGCDLTLRRTVPARVSKSNGTLIHDGDHEFGWVCAVPRGTVGGTIILDGETSTITGDAYHDHNWVSTTMGSMLHHWHWGRAAIGPYTAVIMTVYPLKAFAGTHAGGLQSMFVASPDDVMVNVEGYDAALVDATPGTNPDPRNPQAYYAPEIRYEVDREGRRVAVQFHNAAFISSAELATETKFVTDDERERAKSLPVKPWYSRFVAPPVSLTITENGKEHTFTGEGVTDFMDFHLSD